ncbi:MAG: hypothetical protein EOO78_10575 [Oxalobacteraceae bacterium]|nr:MAG: hypothetical protein EOO78_10575 [Oxalobacteraceae bacterium]
MPAVKRGRTWETLAFPVGRPAGCTETGAEEGARILMSSTLEAASGAGWIELFMPEFNSILSYLQ